MFEFIIIFMIILFGLVLFSPIIIYEIAGRAIKKSVGERVKENFSKYIEIGVFPVSNSNKGKVELIPKVSRGRRYVYKTFNFKCDTANVEVKINNEKYNLMHGEFISEVYDAPVYSFIVVTPNVQYTWRGRVEGQIGQMAYLEDSWYKVENRKEETGKSGDTAMKYKLDSKDKWFSDSDIRTFAWED